MSSFNTKHDDPWKHYSIVTKLVHYSSKFTLNDDGRPPKHHPSTRSRLSSTLDSPDKPIESRRFRLAPIWPEWNETEINNELWDSGIIRKKESTTAKSRADTKANAIMITHHFEDPDGKIELPPSFKVEQWKRPVDFLPSDKPPVVVDADFGLHYFDLIALNEHLHHNEIMRDIISQITALWNICRKESKTPPNPNNRPAINERTWRPWEHIYALNKVSKHPFITPYNPMGKYVVRLFFLGTWRKIVIDDSIPFDSQNRCLLPQTTLSHELWPMLLTKALLKIISLGFSSLDDLIEYNETSVIHSLTGWIPEPIPLKYTYAEKIWDFLRYDRSNKSASENDLSSSLSLGPIPLYKWFDSKPDLTTEKTLLSGQNLIEQPKDPTTNTVEEKNVKKVTTTLQPLLSRESTGIRSANLKENRTIAANNSPLPAKEVKRSSGPTRGGTIYDFGMISDDQGTTEAPKRIIFATMSHLHPSRLSSYGETADRSERLRRYNLNETFSTSIVLTSIRDIPLKPPASSSPPSSETLPAWKLIRPRKSKVLPHAEPIIPQETKSERWIEIASPYINYPTASALNIKPTIRSHLTDHNNPMTIASNKRLHHPRKHSAMSDPLNIMEVEEDEDLAKEKIENPLNDELVRSITSISLPTTKKELNVVDIPDKSDTSTRSAGSKSKRESFMEKTKISRKSIISGTKLPSDTLSIKSKDPENEQLILPIEVPIIVDTLEEENALKKPDRLSKIWMNFDDFCSCFTSIIVFHNPRGYQYNHKHTEIKFTAYQPPIAPPVTREKKREVVQPVIQPIPSLQDDKSAIYLFVDSTRDTLEKNIQFIISLTCLPRWYDAVLIETPSRSANVSAEKLSPDLNSMKIIVSQKEVIPQTGSLTVESYSWKSLSIGQPILRLQTLATKAALLTLPPGRHVLKLTNTCPFAFNLQILSDTTDFMLVDEDQLLIKLVTNPEDAEFLLRAEELFLALEHSIQNFHLCPQQENKLHELFQTYCQHAPESINLDLQTCFNAFNQALYATIRTMAVNTSGSVITAETQFAWKCFTNDLSSGDILGAYELKRTSTTAVVVPRPSARTEGRSFASTRRSGHRSSSDKNRQGTLPHSSSISDVQEEGGSDWFSRELSSKEIDAIISIQKCSRNFLQRRMSNARKCGTEKNLTIQRALKSTLAMLKIDFQKSALLLFKNFISFKPQLIECFAFHNDDWNMVHYHDYNGFYQEQPANTWFILFREIFYFTEENFLVAKFLSHLPNSLLRVINNDTCEEIPLVFNRLAPGIFSKNKHGYTFLAEGISFDQSISTGRFRLRLITSYARLPEPCTDPITSSFLNKEITDYYLPNKEATICRYRVLVAEDVTQTGRKFHLASIHFSTSKPDVFIRLSLFDYDYEIASVEGKGSVVLPAVLFMRSASNLPALQSPPSKPPSKTTGSQKKSSSGSQRGSIGDLAASCKERITSGKRSRSTSRVGLLINDTDDKPHKYIIQVTVLRKSWPLTSTQWQFVEQLKEQQKSESKVSATPLSPIIKTERRNSNTTIIKRSGSTSPNASTTTTTTNAKGRSKTVTTPSGRINPGKSDAEKSTIDITKAHYILRIVSDADKAEELTFKKDNERNEELMNMKKAWETFQPGRAEKAMQSRQKFLDSLQIQQPINGTPTTPSDVSTLIETPHTNEPLPPPPPVVKPISSRKKSPFSTKKGSVREEILKPMELTLSQTPIDEPLLHESPFPKPTILLPPLDLQSFTRRKFSSNESILSDFISEGEDLEHRRNDFNEYLEYLKGLYHSRETDLNHRSEEKIRQLEEYVDLQSRIDQIRRTINEPREVFRQRFLEIERQRLQLLAAEQQRLLDEAKASTAAISKPKKKKTSAGKKKKN